jgi:hypothetical protein
MHKVILILHHNLNSHVTNLHRCQLTLARTRLSYSLPMAPLAHLALQVLDDRTHMLLHFPQCHICLVSR